eukprot:TRINITY_DN6874_c0_g1_i1.p1 TRINITY_DN6874_c0_g1~~TRINITY_DN6874_c0_g1_i1.p1  ORF type:complete len:537 (-),score=104.53 TRINITY_DN6874_c0_g1_i1:47-1657(-)
MHNHRSSATSAVCACVIFTVICGCSLAHAAELEVETLQSLVIAEQDNYNRLQLVCGALTKFGTACGSRGESSEALDMCCDLHRQDVSAFVGPPKKAIEDVGLVYRVLDADSNCTENCTEPIVDPCALDADALAVEYDMPLHIGAIFILLVVSLFGTLLPVIGGRVPRLRIPAVVLKLGRAFGAGVILATAFVHMLPPAFAALTNECLSTAFTEDYTAYAGLFGMIAVLAVQAVEFFSTVLMERSFHHDHSHEHVPTKERLGSIAGPDYPMSDLGTVKPTSADVIAAARNDDGTPRDVVDSGSLDVVVTLPQPAEADDHSEHSEDGGHDHHHHHHHHNDLQQPRMEGEHTIDDEHGHTHMPAIASGRLFGGDIPMPVRMKIIVLVLELGIAFHSVIVGVSLGAIRGGEFRTLLIALSFHQFFEGFALGATVLEANFVKATPVVATVIWYTLTTPIGVIIGICIANTYNENSATALLVQGVLDSVSGGILIYTALVEILTYQFTNSQAFRADTKLVKGFSFLCLYIGAGLMAFLGRYA